MFKNLMMALALTTVSFAATPAFSATEAEVVASCSAADCKAVIAAYLAALAPAQKAAAASSLAASLAAAANAANAANISAALGAVSAEVADADVQAQIETAQAQIDAGNFGGADTADIGADGNGDGAAGGETPAVADTDGANPVGGNDASPA